MPDARLSPQHRRTVLEQLTRDRLGEIARHFELEVEDRRSLESHVDAIVRKRTLDFAAVLDLFRREELQRACEVLGLDTSGREKAALIGRILGVGNGYPAPPTPEALGVSDVAGTFTLTPASAKTPAARAPATARTRTNDPVTDYRFPDATRTNNPPAGLVEFDKPPARKSRHYQYDPHLDPQLAWAGKQERASFEVDTVSLHIHERVSTQAILRAVKREEAQRNLFADNELPEGKSIEFYSHDVGWSNRLVLGDSLLVMNSLLERERMAGKVQCIYMDPPYGVKFASNFQPSMSRRDVKDDDAGLTREPEQIQAYRDTWDLGVHSYLTYMRDRLLLSRELLTTAGSIFVQISDENVHHVRELLDEVFGPDNFVSLITYRTSVPLTSAGLPSVTDFILWYAREKGEMKFRPLFISRETGDKSRYSNVELPTGERRSLTNEERLNPDSLPKGARMWTAMDLASSGYTASCTFAFDYKGTKYQTSSGKSWKTTKDGMERLARVGRITDSGKTIRYITYLDDFPVMKLANAWYDTTGELDKSYVVQTHTKVIERCMLMSTDPGDLVFDPTCGGGTTAIVAEQFGRRWVTCDTSRVALSLARQRILTGRFPYFRLRTDRVRDGFVYRTAPHITLGAIANNPKLDTCTTRTELERAIRDAAEQEVLFDQPEEDRGRIRVAGPFSVEAIPVASLDEAGDHSNEPDEAAPASQVGRVADPAGDYLSMMTDLVRKSGIVFANGKHLRIPAIRSVKGSYEYLHAEGESELEGDPRRIAISFGSKHAPITPMQVRDALVETRGYDWVLFVGFGCDPEARRMIDQGVHGRQLDFANAAPDILVGDLLKTRKADKLFSVFGAPDVKVWKEAGDLISAELVGVDLYDPITGHTTHDKGENVAAWFVDHDYDGRTFCICQALFPSRSTKNPWEKLQRALKGTIDEQKFEQLRTTRSLPFRAGKKVAVTVIDDRGNEVITVVDAARAR